MGLDMFLFDEKGNEIGYQRKANQVHGWFVENIQDGYDECDMYQVTKSDLRILRDTCQEVLDDNTKAEELLPTRSGFFFGGTTYDDWYFDDLIDTIRICNKIIEDEEIKEIYYQSSW